MKGGSLTASRLLDCQSPTGGGCPWSQGKGSIPTGVFSKRVDRRPPASVAGARALRAVNELRGDQEQGGREGESLLAQGPSPWPGKFVPTTGDPAGLQCASSSGKKNEWIHCLSDKAPAWVSKHGSHVPPPSIPSRARSPRALPKSHAPPAKSSLESFWCPQPCHLQLADLTGLQGLPAPPPPTQGHQKAPPIASISHTPPLQRDKSAVTGTCLWRPTAQNPHTRRVPCPAPGHLTQASGPLATFTAPSTPSGLVESPVPGKVPALSRCQYPWEPSLDACWMMKTSHIPLSLLPCRVSSHLQSSGRRTHAIQPSRDTGFLIP